MELILLTLLEFKSSICRIFMASVPGVTDKHIVYKDALKDRSQAGLIV